MSSSTPQVDEYAAFKREGDRERRLNPPVPQMRTEMVTAARAREILARNYENRPVVKARVAGYMRAMLSGEWRTTSTLIGIDWNGDLTNGQHRLSAVIEADNLRPGFAVQMSFLVDVDPESRDFDDIGYSRSRADRLRRMGVPSAKRVATVANYVFEALVGWYQNVGPDTLEKAHDYFREEFEWADEVFTRRTGIDSTTVVAAFVFAYRTQPAKVREFAHLYRTGDGVKVGDPSHTLRKLILEGKRSQGASGEGYRSIFKKALRAIMAYIEDESIPTNKLYATDKAIEYFRPAHLKLEALLGLNLGGGVTVTLNKDGTAKMGRSGTPIAAPEVPEPAAAVRREKAVSLVGPPPGVVIRRGGVRPQPVLFDDAADQIAARLRRDPRFQTGKG